MFISYQTAITKMWNSYFSLEERIHKNDSVWETYKVCVLCTTSSCELEVWELMRKLCVCLRGEVCVRTSLLRSEWRATAVSLQQFFCVSWTEKQRSVLVLQTSPWDSETSVFCSQSCCSSHTPHSSRALPERNTALKKVRREDFWSFLSSVRSFIHLVSQVESYSFREHHCAKHIFFKSCCVKKNTTTVYYKNVLKN